MQGPPSNNNLALSLVLSAFLLILSGCANEEWDDTEQSTPYDPGGYWVCKCAGFACFFYPDCYWVADTTAGAIPAGFPTGRTAPEQTDPPMITAPTSGEEFILPPGQTGVTIGGTVFIPPSEEKGEDKPRMVVINISADIFWLAEVKCDPSGKEGLYAWETFASREGGLLVPGMNHVRVEAVDSGTRCGVDEVAIVTRW